MKQYDGEIRINTKIQTDEAEKELLKLQNSMNKTAHKVHDITKKMRELENAKVENTAEWKKLRGNIDSTKQRIQTLTEKAREMRNVEIPTDEYKEVQAHITDTKSKLSALHEKMEKYVALGKDVNANSFKAMEYDAEELKNTLKFLNGEMKELKESGKAFVRQKGTEAYKALKVDLQAAYKEMRRLKAEESTMREVFNSDKTSGIKMLSNDLETAQREMELTKRKLQEVAASKSKLEKSGFGKFAQGIRKAAGSMKKLTKNTRSANKGFSNLIGTIKQMVLSMAVFTVMQKGLEFLKSGLQNLALYSQEYNASMSQLMSSTGQLKNAFAAAFQPILNIVIPILAQLIDKISAAANEVSRFFAILRGKSTYTKAIKQNKNYAASLDKVGGAADKAKGSLAGFDELEVMQKNDAGSGGGGSSSGGADGSGFIEESVGDTTAIEEVKNALLSLFEPLKQSWDEKGAGVINSAKFALKEIKQLCIDVGISFGTVWANGTGVLVCNNILDILRNVLLTVGNIASGLDEAWNFNNTGTKIVQSLFNILLNVLTAINDISAATALWSANLDFTPIFTSFERLLSAVEPFTSTICDGLVWLYEKVLLPFAAWAIEDAIPVFFELLAGAIHLINSVLEVFKPLGIWLWETFLKPIAEWTGGIICEVLGKLAELLTQIGDWILEHQNTVEVWVVLIGSIVLTIGTLVLAIKLVSTAVGLWTTATTLWSAASAVATTATTLWSAASAVATTVTTAFGAAIAFLTSPIGIVIAVIGTLIAVGVLLCKNWEDIKKSWEETKKIIVARAQDLKTEWDTIFNGIKSKISTTLENIKEKARIELETLKAKWEAVLNAIDTTVKTIFNGIRNKISTTIENIKKKVSTEIEMLQENWDTVWNDMKTSVEDIFKGIWNSIRTSINNIISGVERMANGVINAINGMIKALNALSFTAPDWIPEIGGKTFGLNISTIDTISIPRLARGGITTGSTLAEIGEAGREAVLPLERNTEWMDTFAQTLASKMNGSGTQAVNLTVELDGNTVYRRIVQLDREFAGRTGSSQFLYGY